MPLSSSTAMATHSADDEAALHAAASALLQQGKYARAWATAFENRPPPPRSWWMDGLKARILLEWAKETDDASSVERFEASLEAFASALALLPEVGSNENDDHAKASAEEAELENDRGVALYELERLPEARRAFERTLELCPGHGRALTNLGLIHWSEGRERIALHCFGNAIATGGDGQHAHNNRGALLVELGETEQALPDFHAALALNPSYDTARRNRDEALSALDEPVPMTPVPE